MLQSTLTKKGQVTIPAPIRQALELHPGDQVSFKFQNDHIVLERKENDITAAFGLVKTKHSASLDDIKKAIRKKAGHDNN